jgi:hypothetical protein
VNVSPIHSDIPAVGAVVTRVLAAALSPVELAGADTEVVTRVLAAALSPVELARAEAAVVTKVAGEYLGRVVRQSQPFCRIGKIRFE